MKNNSYLQSFILKYKYEYKCKVSQDDIKKSILITVPNFKNLKKSPSPIKKGRSKLKKEEQWKT